jgi:hypothetical protein
VVRAPAGSLPRSTPAPSARPCAWCRHT